MKELKFDVQLFKKALQDKSLFMRDLIPLLEERGVELSENTLSSWTRTRDPRFPNIPKLIEVSKVIDVDYRDLIGLPRDEDSNFIYIDKYDMVAGAGSAGVFDIDMPSTQKIGIDKSILARYDTKHIKIFECIGDSMEPEFNEGDYVFVDMVDGRDFVKIPDIYIVRVGDTVQIKRVEFLGGIKVKLISLNPKYGEYYPHKNGEECEILGKVCGRIELKKGLSFEDYGIR